VFINGVEQSEGNDYRVSDGDVVFSRPISRRRS